MAFQFAVLAAAVFAVASAGVISPANTFIAAPVLAKVANPAVDAVASTHQNVVRSFGGTVSSYSKAVDTPYSSVRKEDTRINNNVYTPAVAKTVAYAAPTHTEAVYSTHVAPMPALYESHHYEPAPTVASALHHEAQPAHVYHHEAAPSATTTYHHSPSASTYSHNAPGVTAYGSSQTVHYSPAEMVSHMSFDGFGTHWGY